MKSAAKSRTCVIGDVSNRHKQFLIVSPCSGLVWMSLSGGRTCCLKYLRIILLLFANFVVAVRTGERLSFCVFTVCDN